MTIKGVKMNRRGFLLQALLGMTATQIKAPLAHNIEFSVNPFTLGIASGDVTESSVVLWSRLAPEPSKAGGGMESFSVPVQWELSLDAKMSRIIQRGELLAEPALAHSVHVDVQNLESSREYWYRFTAATHKSQIGRTKTLPYKDSHTESVRFITCSCQNYTHGYFVAYEHMISDRPDFVIHLGDYIYDTSFGETFRKHDRENAPSTLADYRRRHALYKTDRHLQRAHAALPFFTVIDNHDAIEDMDPAGFAKRAAAYQAWYEHMPVRGYGVAGDNHFSLHRLIQFGDLMQINLLDTRQFRDKKDLCTDNLDTGFGFGNYRERCDELFPEDRTMLGGQQEQWLHESLVKNRAAWNVVASSVPFLPFHLQVDGKQYGYIGAWDAYPANRARIVQAISKAKSGHPIVLSGDVHSFWALDGALAKQEVDRIPVVEFITSSISANWPEPLSQPITENLEHNPQVLFYDGGKRGYLLHEVNKRTWTTTLRAVDDKSNNDSTAHDLATFNVTNGEPGIRRSS